MGQRRAGGVARQSPKAPSYDHRREPSFRYSRRNTAAGGQPAAAVASALGRTTSATGELTRDEIFDNITLYWLTNTGVSASRLYWEYKGGFFNAKGVSIPVAATVFPGEQYQAPRSWAERAYPNLIYYNQVPKGGHFAA
jgi:hypothetical protein